jgi:hypothetical protein
VTGPGLRASDDDRHRVVAELERHTTAGRLSLDEYSERVSRAYAAATRSELARITEDLPAEPLTLAPTTPSTPEHRQLLLAFLLAMATIVIIGLVLAVAK